MRAPILGVLLLAACETEGEGEATGGSSGGASVDYAMDIQPIWNAACTCHLQGPSGTMIAEVLTLNEDVSHAQLLAPSEQLPAMPRVTPNDPEQSYLWHKLSGTHLEVGGSTAAMPMIGMLGDEELATIEQWILQSAPM